MQPSALSPWSKGYYIKAIDWDFFLHNQFVGVQRLTDIGYRNIHAVSLSDDGIVFEAYLPNSEIPREWRLPEEIQSDLSNFRSSIRYIEKGKSIHDLTVGQTSFYPLVEVGSGYNFRPSATPGRQEIALHSASYNPDTEKWFSIAVYDLVVQKVVKRIEEQGPYPGSKPTLLSDGRVIYIEFLESIYHIMSYSIDDDQIHEIDRIDSRQIPIRLEKHVPIRQFLSR